MVKKIKDNKRNSRRAKGFTLIEILAALALIIFVIPVVMKGISIATAVASDIARKSVAASLAENQLADILIEKQWQNSSLTGDFGKEYPAYRWQMTSANWTEPGLNQVTLSVMWESRGYGRKVELTTLVWTNEQ
ncbi:MAG: type II secretion system protein [Sedimentisphaerales bacterium]|nr:type II secretion system protein [Sedimentisphaerales bacterium]